VLGDALLALDLGDRSRRRVNVEKHKMRLAVLVHAVGEGAHAPVLGLGDLAAGLFDNAGHLGGQFFHLLGARVLTREKNMLIKRHGDPFLCWRGFRRQALRDLRKGLGWDSSRRREHGTTDRLALPHQHRLKGEIVETVRSAPGRDPRMRALLRILAGMARKRPGSAGMAVSALYT